jgi:hypothetical protein
MSTGRRLPAERSPPPPYHRSSGSDSAGYHTSPYSMYPSPPEYSSAGRPSVITCASSLRSSPAPSCPSPCSSTGSVSSSARPASPSFQSTAPSVSSVRNQRHNDDGRPPHRREVISSGRHLFASAQTRKSFLLVNLLPRNGEKPGRPLAGIKKNASLRSDFDVLEPTSARPFSFFHPPVPCVGLLLLILSPDTVTVGRRWIKMPEGAIPVGPEATLALLGFIYSLAPRLPPGVLAKQDNWLTELQTFI